LLRYFRAFPTAFRPFGGLLFGPGQAPDNVAEWPAVRPMRTGKPLPAEVERARADANLLIAAG